MSVSATEHEVFEELRPPVSRAEALLEADRCLECGGPYAEAPCTVACPADVDVSAFVGAIAGGDPSRAERDIFAENLLGGTCARVCPVEILCEGACVLQHEGGRPIEIGASSATRPTTRCGRLYTRQRRRATGCGWRSSVPGRQGLPAPASSPRPAITSLCTTSGRRWRARPLRHRPVPPAARAAARGSSAARAARRGAKAR